MLPIVVCSLSFPSEVAYPFRKANVSLWFVLRDGSGKGPSCVRSHPSLPPKPAEDYRLCRPWPFDRGPWIFPCPSHSYRMLLLTDDLQDRGCCKQRKSSDQVHCLAGSPQPFAALCEGTAWMFPLLGQGVQNCDWSWLWWCVPGLGGRHQVSECLHPSKFQYVPGRRRVTLYRLF